MQKFEIAPEGDEGNANKVHYVYVCKKLPGAKEASEAFYQKEYTILEKEEKGEDWVDSEEDEDIKPEKAKFDTNSLPKEGTEMGL